MVGGPLTERPGAERVRDRSWHRLPAAVRIGVLYLAARVVTTAMFALASALSTPESRFGAAPGVGTLLMGWDAQWYWYIAVHGYPTRLPVDATGAVQQNGWAFMPLYPYLARLLGGPGAGWQVAAILISLVAGYLASLVLYRLLRERLPTDAATWAVVFFACAPVAAVFQIGYAESLFLLWVFLAVWATMRRRYAWLYLLIPLMGFTRPGVLAFALFLGLHGVQRWWMRRTEPLPARHVVHIVALGALGCVVGFAWPVIAGIVTGRADAYMATELSWRRGWVDESGFVPGRGFWDAAALWFRTWGLPETVGHIALIVLVLLAAAALVFDPRVRRLGAEIRLWLASYALYLLAVFFPQSSVFRLMVPLSPAWGAVAVPRSTRWRSVVLALCLAGQWVWIFLMYGRGNTFWQIP
ncbi:mannosyltransferase family protein [Microbacterium luticocti]|uniref:mannosyltransferase family protein n=1 Tax=Microbacterium luticocti TaxID=451764 RepID=UPI000412F114|nr:mannosyltransferase family protein [Microbacterium luticocti]